MNPRLVPVVLLVLFSGCGYTIVRDFDAETLQRESAIHDTLTLAPDLIVTELEFEYVPPPPRRDALDIVVQPHRLIVYISIENVGNADFTNPYLLLIRNPTAKPLHIHAPIR